MSYTPIFTKPYADGYKNKPNRTTPVTAEIKNKETETLLAIEAYLEALQIPEKLSELTNDEGFIKNTVSNLANYYLKSETYTQAEVQALIADAVAKVSGKLNISVVDALPTSDISTTTFYLVPKETAQEKNIYDEYINTDGTESGWEIIGAVSTSVDLSEYYKKSEVDTLIANKVNTSDLVPSKFIGTKAVIGNQVSSGVGGSALHVYSTEEQVVATWIDGRPVYEKSIDNLQILVPAQDWTTLVDLSDLNADNVFVSKNEIRVGENDLFYFDSYYFRTKFSKPDKCLKYYVTEVTTGTYSCSITIQYTKTTDTATT